MFSDLLKQAMEERNWNATALSAATGIGKSSISQYLSGKNEPTEKRKAAIAVALELPPDYFKTKTVQADVSNTAKLTVTHAAKLMGKGKEFVYQGLRDGVFPWGYAVNMNGRWNYYISPIKFQECTGLAV